MKIVLEYKDKSLHDKAVIVNNYEDGLWIADFDTKQIIDVRIENCYWDIIEDLDLEQGIIIDDWFKDAMISFCETEIEEGNCQELVPLLEELKSC